MARGRPKKVEMSIDDLIAKANRHDYMTLDEASRLMGSAYYETTDPKTGVKRLLEPKKMTVMGFQKFEQRTLAKFKTLLAQKGIKSRDDIFEPKFRVPAKAVSTREY